MVVEISCTGHNIPEIDLWFLGARVLSDNFIVSAEINGIEENIPAVEEIERLEDIPGKGIFNPGVQKILCSISGQVFEELFISTFSHDEAFELIGGEMLGIILVNHLYGFVPP